MGLRVTVHPSFFVAPALLLIVGLCLPAQQRLGAPSAVIDGVVTDSSLRPLGDATAWILGSDIRVNTGPSGRFRILRVPAGQYILVVRRLGYALSSTALRTDGMAVNRRTLPAKTCPFQFFVDGILIPPPKSVDHELPSPKEIAGIEVYANSATIPLQYKTFGGSDIFNYGGGFCGVILLWTRSG